MSDIEIRLKINSGDLNDAHSALDRLIVKLKQVGTGPGGGLGGLVGVTTNPQVPGVAGSTVRAGGGGGGGNPIVAAVANAANSMKVTAKGGVDAFKDMGRALLDFTSIADSRLMRLSSIFSRVAQSFGAVKGLMGGGGTGAPGGGATGAGGQALQQAVRIAIPSAGLSQAGLARMTTASLGASAAKYFGAGPPPPPAGPLAPGAALTSGMSLLGGLGWGIGGALAVGAVAYGMHSMAQQNYDANLAYQVASPLWSSQQQGRIGSLLAPGVLGIRHGNVLSETVSMNRALVSDEGKWIVSEERLAKQKEQIERTYPMNLKQAGASAKFGGYWAQEGAALLNRAEQGAGSDKATGKVGAFGGLRILGIPLLAASNNYFAEKDQLTEILSDHDIKQRAALKDLVPKATEDLLEQQSIQRMTNPIYFDILNEAEGRVATVASHARAMQRGGGFIRTGLANSPDVLLEAYGVGPDEVDVGGGKRRGGPWDQKNPFQIADEMLWLEGDAKEHGYQMSDRVSIEQRMSHAVGIKRMHDDDPYSILGMIAGGLTNAPELRGVAGQFGRPGAIMQLLAGSGGLAGAGGLDPIAMNQVGGTWGAAMASGNAAGSGIGLLSLLGQASYRDGGTGDIRGAREAAAGLGAINGMTTGRDSPWQKVVNLNAVQSILPKADMYVKQFLATLPAEQMLNAIHGKGGESSEMLAAMGVDPADLKKLFNKEQHDALSIGVFSGMGPLPYKKALEAYRNDSTFGFLKDKDNAYRLKYMKELGAGEALLHPERTKEANMGLVALAMAQAGMAPKFSGAGVRSAFDKNSPTAKILEIDGKIDKLRAREFVGMNENVRKDIEASIDRYRHQQENLGADISAGGGDPKAAVEDVRKALTRFADSMTSLVGKTTGGATKKAPSAVPPGGDPKKKT